MTTERAGADNLDALIDEIADRRMSEREIEAALARIDAVLDQPR